MAKTSSVWHNGVWNSVGSNGSQPVIYTASKNADGTPVKAPDKRP